MTLLIAMGNPWRRDDGAAHRVLELLGTVEGARICACLQLTPEMAEDLAPAGTAVFIDADVNPGAPRLEPLVYEPAPPQPLSHSVSPAELVEIARQLFNFRGQAYICHVPGADFGEGEGLTPETEANARLAADLLRGLVHGTFPVTL